MTERVNRNQEHQRAARYLAAYRKLLKKAGRDVTVAEALIDQLKAGQLAPSNVFQQVAAIHRQFIDLEIYW